MAVELKVKTPKQGDHVNATQHQGIFEVVGVNTLIQTANIRLADRSGQVIPNVPWTDLKVLGKK
jgi:hypothetical protein